MDVSQAIQTRRAIKHYDSSHRMSEEEINLILDHAMLAPTAFNIQNWRFVVVTDQELRKRIREVAWDQTQVTDASVLIILTADKRAWAKSPERYWRNAPKEVGDILVPALQGYYNGRESVAIDECHRSCGMAGMTIMLQAKAMGYDSCPMDGFDFEKVAQLINLPEDHVISFMIAIGKGTKQAWPRPGQLPRDEVAIRNHF